MKILKLKLRTWQCRSSLRPQSFFNTFLLYMFFPKKNINFLFLLSHSSGPSRTAKSLEDRDKKIKKSLLASKPFLIENYFKIKIYSEYLNVNVCLINFIDQLWISRQSRSRTKLKTHPVWSAQFFASKKFAFKFFFELFSRNWISVSLFASELS